MPRERTDAAKTPFAPFEIPTSPVGAPAGSGRCYEVTLSRRGATEVVVVDVLDPAIAQEVEAAYEDLGAIAKGSIDEDAVEADRVARKRLATGLVDYESFGGDSAYMDRFDVVRDSFTTVDVRRAGTRVRYDLLIAYGDAGDGMWDDSVEATDREDAEFQGRWTCAGNCGTGKAPSSDPDAPGTTAETMVDGMDFRVIDCDLAQVRVDEIADAVMDLATLFASGGDVEAAIRSLVVLASQCTGKRPVVTVVN